MLQQRRHRRRNTSSRSRSSSNSCRVNYLPGLLIVLLVLLQSFELHMCRQLMGAGLHMKRSLAETQAGRDVSQPEEIFSAPSDASDMSYDEYPMVVPKRAALLLDRLMVALHHALENEREGHRIGDFYANKNLIQLRPTDFKNGLEQLQATEEGNTNMPMNSHNFHMYSDDDPGVMMDYDFKDLNQINRATGETLMAKSFQRRAGGVGLAAGNDAALIATTTSTKGLGGGGGGGSSTSSGSILIGTGAGPGPGARRIHHVANGGGRMYWRCYFNAVSCF